MLDICITFTVLQMKRYEEEVREEQARRKAEGMTAKYKSLKKRSRKHGCSSNTDIAPVKDIEQRTAFFFLFRSIVNYFNLRA